MIAGWWLAASLAWAGGPAILDVPISGQGGSVGVVGGSGSGWFAPRVGLAAWATRTGGMAVAATGRWSLARNPGGLRVEVRLAGGLAGVARQRPAIGITAVPVLVIGHVLTRFTGGLSVSAPATLGFAGRATGVLGEVPVIVGLHLGGPLKDRVWLVASLRGGAAWRLGDVPGPAIVFDPGVTVMWRGGPAGD